MKLLFSPAGFSLPRDYGIRRNPALPDAIGCHCGFLVLSFHSRTPTQTGQTLPQQFVDPIQCSLRSSKGLKMKKLTSSVCLFLLLLLPVVARAASSRDDLQVRIDNAKTVLDQIMNAQDSTIPSNILARATCVGVVPGLKKAAFVFGGQYGQGVVTCRTGHGWSAPVFIRMAGGSWGLQLGAQSTDLVLIAVNEQGFQDLLKDKFKIGADAAATAGPVGRNGQAATDWKMNAELLTYSRSKGLFAGIDLDGTSVSQNTEDTTTYYGHDHAFEDILRGKVDVPVGAVSFVRTVAHDFVAAKRRQ